jgi:hypothetical protein
LIGVLTAHLFSDKMPFTLSHPLAIVPLARTRLVFSALVIGSMSPDFEYFVQLDQSGHASHSMLGVALFCLPASLLVYWLWHGFMKLFLVQILPTAAQRKLAPLCASAPARPVAQAIWVVASVIVGAVTHVVWDSFTHPWGWPVQNFEFFHYQVTDNGFLPMKVFKFLQYGSSIGGLALLAWLGIRWYRQAATIETKPLFTARTRWALLCSIIGVAVIVGVSLAWRRFPPTVDMDHLKAFIVRSLVGVMAFVLWETIVLSICYRWRFGRPKF